MNDIYFMKKFDYDGTGQMLWYKRILKTFETEEAANKESKFLWKMGSSVRVVKLNNDKWCVYYRG